MTFTIFLRSAIVVTENLETSFQTRSPNDPSNHNQLKEGIVMSSKNGQPYLIGFVQFSYSLGKGLGNCDSRKKLVPGSYPSAFFSAYKRVLHECLAAHPLGL